MCTEVNLVCVRKSLILSLSSVCGRAPLSHRIVGGENATEGDWPWQVSIHLIGVGHICGGTLITKDWVLSAAHCFFQSYNESDIEMYFGRLSQFDSNPHETNRTASRIISHPDYNDSTYDNDIALIELSFSVDFSDYIRPVCLAAAASVFTAGTESWVTGWGQLQSEDTQGSDILQELMIPVVSNSDCDNAYGGSITSNMICAGFLNQGGKSICLEDSGGPMVSRNSPLWIQSGISSFTGEKCDDPKFPSVFARVSQYEDWIKSYMGSNPPGFVLTPTPPTTPNITSTPPTTPNITSTPPTTPNITSTPPTTPNITSTPPTTPNITSTPPTTPNITSTPPTTPNITTNATSNSHFGSAPNLLLFPLSLTVSFIPFTFSLFLSS
ncbi:serine protease 30-like [Carassius carassius]|uniref:serine protease 30-like n=1 Tax=Carassius carassius TaxID=217509 RepID=UPI0028686BFC|nr:serine protease 30-like [Carassius carassius]